MKIFPAALSAAVCLAGMAFAATAASAQSKDTSAPNTRVPDMAQTAANEAAAPKKVCRSERLTGSLTRVRRVCQTQAEWDAQAQNAREGVDRYTRSTASQPSSGSSNMPGL